MFYSTVIVYYVSLSHLDKGRPRILVYIKERILVYIKERILVYIKERILVYIKERILVYISSVTINYSHVCVHVVAMTTLYV